MNTFAACKLLFIFYITTFLTGCFLDTKIGQLDGLNNSSKELLTPVISPIITTISTNKSVSFSASGGTPPYSYAILQGSGTINPSTGAYSADSATGSALIEVVDANGKKSQASVTINHLPSLGSSQFDLFVNSGFGLEFLLPTPNGGVPTFTYSLQSGVGTVTGNKYTPPSTAGTAVVKISDQFNDNVSLNVKVRSFDLKYTLFPPVSATGTPIFSSMTQVGPDLFAAINISVPFSNRPYFESSKPGSIYFYKTSDLGNTWIYLSAYRNRAESTSTAVQVLYTGSKIILVGNSNLVGSTVEGDAFIAESTDSGTTWIAKDNFLVTGSSEFNKTAYLDAILAADGNLVLSGTASHSSTSRIQSFIRKCNVTTWTCSTISTYDSNNSLARNYIRAIRRAANGDLYLGQLYGTNSSDGAIYVKKSTDSGVTWTTLYNDPVSSTSISDFAISSNGQTLIVSGALGASTPYTRVSFNGGSTWNYIGGGNACPGWEVTKLIVNDSTGDALSHCFNFSSGYTGYVSKLLSGGTTWSTLQTIAGNSIGFFFKFTNGNVLLVTYVGAVPTVSITNNFGASFTAATAPTISFPPDGDVNDIIQSDTTTFYSVGSYGTTTASQRQGKIYTSTNSGTTWTVVHSLADTYSKFTAIGKSSTTNTMIASAQESYNKWVSYRSTNGTVWTGVDSQTMTSSWFALPKKVLSNSAGYFMTLGLYKDPTAKEHWYTRGSADDGLTWTLIEDYVHTTNYNSGATGGIADGNNFIVIGYGVDNVLTSHWLVRQFNGTTWTVLDDYVGPYGPSTVTNARPISIVKTTDGDLYVLGEYTTPSNYRTWLIRRKLAGSSVWENVDTFQASPIGSSFAKDITVDAQGRIFAIGYGDDGKGLYKVYTRIYQNSIWQTIDVYKAGYSENTPTRIIPCLTSQVCTVGNYLDSYSQSRGFVRFLSP